VPELAQEELDVRAREAVHGRKAQRGIFGDHWAADLPRGIARYRVSVRGFEKTRSNASMWRGEN
jgi:hypothetical protein